MNCQEQIPGAVLYQVVPEVCPVQVPTAAQVVCLEVQEVFLAADPMEAAQEGEAQEVFQKSEVKVWECRNCGHIVVGASAPEICPTCAHPQSYFEISAENY